MGMKTSHICIRKTPEHHLSQDFLSTATDSFTLWEGCGHFEGVPEAMKLLRAESSGLLTTLCFLLCFSWPGCHIKAVENAYVCTPTQCLKPEWDLQMSIEATIKQLCIEIEPQHVYGHQDTSDRGNSMGDKAARKGQL
eukprot:4908412-Ditylum_brightwellii.AAC.1